MKRLTPIIAAVVFAATASVATAQDKVQKPQKPVPMTDAQLEKVAAGALVNAVLIDVVDVRDIQVAVPVNVALGVAALGSAVAAGAVQDGVRQAGRQR